jgi:AraC family transcriptional regulator
MFSAASVVEFSGKTLRSHCTPGFQLTEKVYPEAPHNASHSHANAYLEVTLKGQYVLRLKNKTQVCQPWTMVYHPAGEVHSHYVSPVGARILIIEIASQELRWIRECCSFTEQSLAFEGGKPAWFAARVYREFLQHDSVSPMILEGLALELLAEILRGRESGSVKRIPDWLLRADELIHARFLERLTLTEIAREAGIHPVNLAQEYRRRFKYTVGSKIRQLRIEHASGQIQKTDLPLVDIALASGFSDQSSFTVTFKHLTGMTPSAYRRMARPAKPAKSC